MHYTPTKKTSMAEKADTQLQVKGSPRSEERSNLTCSICLEDFKDPKILPCCHSFCSACLQSIVSSTIAPRSLFVSTTLTQTTVICPQCRSKFDVPLGGIASFPSDFIIVEEIENQEWQKTVHENRSVCGGCGQSGETVSFCQDCEAFLCSYCAGAHRRMKMFSEHTVVDTIDGVEFKPRSKPVHCQHHQHNQVRFLCVTCTKLICDECIVVNSSGQSHRNHTLYTLENKSVSTVTEDMTSLMRGVKQKIGSVEGKVKTLTEINAARGEHCESLKATLKESVDRYIKALNEYMKKELSRIDKQYSTDTEATQKEVASLKSQLAVLNSSLRFACKSKKCSENTHRIVMMAQAMSHLRKASANEEGGQAIHTSIFGARSPHSPITSPLVVDNLEARLVRNGLLRQYTLNDMDIKEPQQSIALGVKTQLSVSISVQPVGQPEFRIVYGSSSFKRKLPASCTTDSVANTWILEFTPCCIGRHRVDVKIFGQWIKSANDLSSCSFNVEGKLKEGDIVRRTSDSKSTPASLLKEGETEDTSIYEIGKLTKVEQTYMGKSMTSSYHVEVTWGHESKNPKTENLSFTWTEYSGYPLELAITEDK